MQPSEQDSTDSSVQNGRFKTTHWNVVLAAAQRDSSQANAALDKLCQTYWYPLYTFIRRSGHDPDDAQDLTQAFFSRLVEKNFIETADSGKGKFRSFLLTAIKRFLVNEWKHVNRQKRGGGRQIVSLDDTVAAEMRFLAEPADKLTPEKAFERRWAIGLLERVINRLESEMSALGKTKLFEELRIFLTGEKSESSHAEIAERLQMSEGTVRVTVHRLRQRYRELLRMEIAGTVATPEEIDEEIRQLFQAVA